MKKDTIIVFTVERSYWAHAATAMRSIMSHRQGLNFAVVSDKDDAKWQKKIDKITQNRKCSVQYIHFDNERIKDLKIYSHAGYATYYKMFLPDILGGNYASILYLDADLVALADIAPLLEIESGDNPIVAREAFGRLELITLNSKMGRSDLVPYCNTGVFLINAARWNECKITSKAVQILTQRPEIITHSEQCAINFACNGCFAHTPLRWNVTELYYTIQPSDVIPGVAYKDVVEAKLHPAIMHFNGPVKPWQMGCIHPERHRYYEYRNQYRTPVERALSAVKRAKERLLKV